MKNVNNIYLYYDNKPTIMSFFKKSPKNPVQRKLTPPRTNTPVLHARGCILLSFSFFLAAFLLLQFETLKMSE